MALWTLISGLAIFLLAMGLLEQALRQLAGGTLQRWLADAQNPYAAATAGVTLTALVQSSSLVSLLVLAFAAAGSLSLANAVAMLAGATVGTTGTGWLVTLLGFKLDLEALAIPVLGAGALASVWSSPERRLYQAGQVAVAFGLLLLGLGLMKSVAADLPRRLPLEMIQGAAWWTFALAGVLVTAVVQSSTAVVLLVLTALHGEVFTLQQGALIAVGANFGTAFTALLAVKGSAVKHRLALANLIYHGYASLIGLLLVGLLAPLLSRAPLDPMLGLVMFHTLFNGLALLLFFFWQRPFVAWLAGRFSSGDRDRVAPYLVGGVTQVPSAAVAAVQRAVRELGSEVLALNARNLHLPSPVATERVKETFEQRYERLKRWESEIFHFVVQAQREKLDIDSADALQRAVAAARDLVFSAKSLKDVRADLALLRHAPQPLVQAFMAPQEEHLRTVYPQLARLLTDDHEPAYVLEQIHQLRAAHERSHVSGDETIHQHGSGLSGSDALLSTLLNVNRELLRSNLDLTRAIARLHGET